MRQPIHTPDDGAPGLARASRIADDGCRVVVCLRGCCLSAFVPAAAIFVSLVPLSRFESRQASFVVFQNRADPRCVARHALPNLSSSSGTCSFPGERMGLAAGPETTAISDRDGIQPRGRFELLHIATFPTPARV